MWEEIRQNARAARRNRDEIEVTIGSDAAINDRPAGQLRKSCLMHGNEEIRSKQKNIVARSRREVARKKREEEEEKQKREKESKKERRKKNRESVAQGEKSKLILYEPTQAFEFGKIRCLD